ncbi:MAG: hypothetical protein WKG00_38825 [Polyangiaceae bacterium]
MPPRRMRARSRSLPTASSAPGRKRVSRTIMVTAAPRARSACAHSSASGPPPMTTALRTAP